MRAQLRNVNSSGFVLGNECKLDISSQKYSSHLLPHTQVIFCQNIKSYVCINSISKNKTSTITEDINYYKYELNECAPVY